MNQLWMVLTGTGMTWRHDDDQKLLSVEMSDTHIVQYHEECDIRVVVKVQ